MPDKEKIIDIAAIALKGRPCVPTDAELRQHVTLAAQLASLQEKSDGIVISSEEIDHIVKILQTRFDTRMGIGALFVGEDYHPWLAAKKEKIDFYYWKRYEKQLDSKFAPDVVLKLDEITDKILDHLEDPTKEGDWARKGLVVGHVQSGKTANYIGLINKAADAGYKVIIVLAGTLNALRNQTQTRIDYDFMGYCTRENKHAGVFFNADIRRRPLYFTNSIKDFNRNAATQFGANLGAISEPVIFVIKKNVSTLSNVKQWLENNNLRSDLRKFPMLLIDDEADYASVNTNSDETNPTKINKGIRELLTIFPKNSFVGYTATPFANIFIDPDNENEMANGEMYKDLFPRDFILSLDAPTNYVGANEIFGDEPKYDILRPILDNEDVLPLKHEKDFNPQQLPVSLEQAIDCFILSKAIRVLRGQMREHHSMMINASRFTQVQNDLKLLVQSFIKERRDVIQNYAALPPAQALQNTGLREINEVWSKEFHDAEFTWEEVQSKLMTSISPVETITVNVASRDPLDYSRTQYPGGRTLITIGGLSLSRGITLEGLTVSYFLRNSVMYDTLLQMGRWFGYRDNYADLCRVFMPESSIAWYAHIAEAVDELREDFKEMERAKLPPIEFGLKVRSHPTALIVTARNKMRTAEEFPVKIGLEGRYAEAAALLRNADVMRGNREVLIRTIQTASGSVAYEKNDLGHFWRGVPIKVLEDLISAFVNSPKSALTTREPLLKYIELLKEDGLATFDLQLRSLKKGENEFQVAGKTVIPIVRETLDELTEKEVVFKKRHAASRGDECAGLPVGAIQTIEREYRARTSAKGNVPDKEYRRYRSENKMPPLLLIMFAHVSKKERTADDEKRKVGPIDVATYGISFPGDSSARTRPERLVSYQVNRIWMREHEDESEPEEEQQP